MDAEAQQGYLVSRSRCRQIDKAHFLPPSLPRSPSLLCTRKYVIAGALNCSKTWVRFLGFLFSFLAAFLAAVRGVLALTVTLTLPVRVAFSGRNTSD